MGATNTKLDTFRKDVEKKLISIFQAKLEEFDIKQVFDWENYHTQFYEGVKAYQIKYKGQVPEEIWQRIEAAGGLQKYSYGYSKLNMNKVYENLNKRIILEAHYQPKLNPNSVINVQELRKLMSSDKTLDRQIFRSNIDPSMNKKISDFNTEDELYSTLVSAYAQYSAHIGRSSLDPLLMGYYKEYTNQIIWNMQKDIADILLNVQVVPLSTGTTLQALNAQLLQKQEQAEMQYNYGLQHPQLRLQSLHAYHPAQTPISEQVMMHQNMLKNFMTQPAPVYQLMLIQ